LLGYSPIDDIILSVRFKENHRIITIIQIYVATIAAEEEENEEFYNILQADIDKTCWNDILIVMEEFTAKGDTQRSEDDRHVLGKFSIGSRNKAEDELVACLYEK
jgi:hypothetical protein